MNYISQFRNWLIRNILLLLMVPVIILSWIYINYANVIGKFLLERPDLFKLYQLKNQITIFTSKIDLPVHITSLGYDVTIFLYILYVVWLATHTYYTYYQLSHNKGSKEGLLMETIILLVVYILFASPKLALWIVLSGYFAISLIILVIALYWIYSIKLKNEEK